MLRHGATVFGLTTAATLWVSAAIGMACGAGMYAVAVVATMLSILVLVSVRFFEENVLTTSTKNIKRLKINIFCENEKSNFIYDHIIENYPRLKEISKKMNKDETLTKISIVLDANGQKPIQTMYKQFQKVEGIESISIQEYID